MRPRWIRPSLELSERRGHLLIRISSGGDNTPSNGCSWRFSRTLRCAKNWLPTGRREVVFYNLGKFSQVISDFEGIHFHSQPLEKYRSFADFLQHRAEDAYPEGWQDNQYATPDAVRVMTVHQAKGMQWPVVFVPALLRNRFPAARIGGRNVWHLLPRAGIIGQARFEGTKEDERRLFYVAMTRSQKFLHLTWAPIQGRNNRYTRASEFWDDILVSTYVKRRVPDYSERDRAEPRPRTGVANVVFSFSDLKYFFECPYQFKLRILYGFNAPIHEALGYGKSLHDALAEVHSRAIRGDLASTDEVPRLVATHLHAPYAYPAFCVRNSNWPLGVSSLTTWRTMRTISTTSSSPRRSLRSVSATASP